MTKFVMDWSLHIIIFNFGNLIRINSSERERSVEYLTHLKIIRLTAIRQYITDAP